MKNALAVALIGLNNTVTTLIADLFEVQVNEVSNEMVNNTGLSATVTSSGWIATVGAGDFSMTFHPGDHGSMAAFGKTLEESIEPLTSFMDDEETEQFVAEISTIPNRVKEIEELRISLLGDDDEMMRQAILAMMISQWYIALRWFEDAEVIGLDDVVTYTPDAEIIFGQGGEKHVLLDNNELPAMVNVNDGTISLRNGTISLETYLEIALRDEDRDDVIFWVNKVIIHMRSLSEALVDLI